MNQHTVSAVFLALMALAALPVSHADTGKAHATESTGSAAATSPMTAGEVKKINKETGKITIKHGPLVNLDMPAMTMVFRVKEPTMLDQVKEGDQIKFVADKVDGGIMVTKLEIAQK